MFPETGRDKHAAEKVPRNRRIAPPGDQARIFSANRTRSSATGTGPPDR